MSPILIAAIGIAMLVIGYIGVESAQDNGLTGSETDHGRRLRGDTGCVTMSIGLLLLIIAVVAELT